MYCCLSGGRGILVIIGMLAFEEKLSHVWLPLVVNSFLLLAVQIRSQWVVDDFGTVRFGIPRQAIPRPSARCRGNGLRPS